MRNHINDILTDGKALSAARKIFRVSRHFPKEEQYALTDQIRRSSRSVCANVAEAWRKRRYPKHFVSKLSDADAEVAETQDWLDFALDCGYHTTQVHEALDHDYDAIAGGLVKMMATPEMWCGPSILIREEEAEYLPE